ncbi:hypothetical protein [Yinghuangia soli]|uniref:ATP-grasp domain-containing protein n=1 Tax=Yinghuangia soli TaxID=2908204 RepID=A0AA41Q7F6_9ACTN|nr:hypothetical protein [Yinghuangia soli]MCF2532999.1 hypothetical protein [Yinghuangia soli]
MTSRQVALLLGLAGHDVDVLMPAGRLPLRLPPSIGRVHPVPAFAVDPWGWLDAAEKVMHAEGHDVLISTGEQTAVLSRAESASSALAGRVAAPRFASLERVQDKVSAGVTLTEIGLPQPEAFVVSTAEALRQVSDPPLYVKLPLGIGGAGVHEVQRREELLRLADRLETEGAFAAGGRVLVQHRAEGRLVTVQAVFDNGRLVAAHTYEHTAPGHRGSAAAKRSIELPYAREHITLLGAHIGWHGALAMDGVLTPEGPLWIDVNPRLVEPANAQRSGVDLLGALIGVSLGQAPPALPAGRPDVLTHQFVPAAFAAAEQGRLAVLRELWRAATRTGIYRGSTEELLPARQESYAIPYLLGLATSLLTAPARALTRTAPPEATPHALTPNAWTRIRAGAPPKPQPGPALP